MNKVLLVLGGIVAIFLSAVIGTQFIGVLGASSESVRVVDAMESLSCSVAIAPATTCIVTLAAPHAHGDTSHLVITETSPGRGISATRSVSWRSWRITMRAATS